MLSAAIVLAIAFVALTSTSVAGGDDGYATATTIRLRPAARVSGASITLGDVGEVTSDPLRIGGVLRSIRIGPGPQPGESRRVSARRIAERLHEHGIVRAWVELKGSREVRVTNRAATATPSRGASKAGADTDRASDPMVIRTGDPVAVEHSGRFFDARTPGKALSGGRLGDPIRVRYTTGRKVVEARVSGPGIVRAVDVEGGEGRVADQGAVGVPSPKQKGQNGR